MDNHRSGLIAIIAIALLGLLWFALSRMPENAQGTDGVPQGTAGQSASALGAITLRHQMSDDMHQYTGTIDLPTPCTSLATETQVTYARPPQVKLMLTTTQGEEICAQVITESEFSFAVSSAEAPSIIAHINGEEVRTTVVEQ